MQALEEARREAGAPAMAAAVGEKGHAAKKWVTGERLLGSGVAVTAQDAWHLGSITKSITSTLIARLVEAGAVRWDDTVGELLKNVAPDMQEVYRSVSFRHLLSHRAGLQRDIPMPLLLKYSPDGTNVRDERASFAREALRMTPIDAKEATFLYSNSGYVVAGAMLEARLDTTWEDLVRTHVFEPLKLTSAGIGPPGEIGKLTQPAGHTYRDGRLIAARVGHPFADNPYAMGPCGRVHMGLDDVLTYLAAHRDGIAFLKPDSWRTLHEPPFGGDYAMGWMVRPDGALWHNGSNKLWYAAALFNRNDKGVVAFVAANEGSAKTWETGERTLFAELAHGL
jgi:CubicO group peptidase (beta-lactamase class C family)